MAYLFKQTLIFLQPNQFGDELQILSDAFSKKGCNIVKEDENSIVLIVPIMTSDPLGSLSIIAAYDKILVNIADSYIVIKLYSLYTFIAVAIICLAITYNAIVRFYETNTEMETLVLTIISSLLLTTAIIYLNSFRMRLYVESILKREHKLELR